MKKTTLKKPTPKTTHITHRSFRRAAEVRGGARCVHGVPRDGAEERAGEERAADVPNAARAPAPAESRAVAASVRRHRHGKESEIDLLGGAYITSPGVDGQKGLRPQFNSRLSSTVDTSIPFSARRFEFSTEYSTYIPCRQTVTCLADSRLRGLAYK
eukprot:1176083-Prorocentrum_minimum.AAC.2